MVEPKDLFHKYDAPQPSWSFTGHLIIGSARAAWGQSPGAL